MTNKVRGYLLNRKRDLENEIEALEKEKLRLQEMLEESSEATPSILPKEAKRVWPKEVESVYRIAMKIKPDRGFEIQTHCLEKNRYHPSPITFFTIYDAQRYCEFYNKYPSIIIDKNGSEIQCYGN